MSAFPLVLAALAPVVLTMVLLLRFKAHHVAPVVLAVSVVLAVLVFDADAGTVALGCLRAAPVALEVLVIVLGGLWLNTTLAAAGVNDAVSDWLSTVGLSTERLVVLVVLGITPFAESITGFGVGAVIAIPVLLAAGLPPGKAAACGLLGFVAVPWGALGPGTLVAAQLAHVDFGELGVASAALSLPVFLVSGFAALVVVAGGRRALRRTADVVGMSLVLWPAIWAANVLLGTQIAGAVGSAVALAVYLAVATRVERLRLTMPARLRTCLAPYALLCALVCAGRFTQAVLLPQGTPAVLSRTVASPALWLLVTCLATGLLLRRLSVPPDLARRCLPAATRKWTPVAVATAGFLLLGAVMTASGISATLADAGARLGAGYLPLIPAIGAVGGFLTGTNTGANAMFAASQALAGQALGANPTLVVALNNVAGSMATMASSPRVALACGLVATVPTPSAGSSTPSRSPEREVFRVTLTVVTINVALYALLFPLLV